MRKLLFTSFILTLFSFASAQENVKTYTNQNIASGDVVTSAQIAEDAGVSALDRNTDLVMNLGIGGSVDSGSIKFNWDTEESLELNSLKINTNSNAKKNGVRFYFKTDSDNPTITILKDFEISLGEQNASSFCITQKYISLDIGGSFISTGGRNGEGIRFGNKNATGSMKLLKVGKDLEGNIDMIKVVGQSESYDDNQWVNAAAQIGGLLKVSSTLLNVESTDEWQKYYKFGGIEQGADIKFSLNITKTPTKLAYSNIMITGVADTSSAEMSGDVISTIQDTGFGHTGTLTMNSNEDFTQKFSGSQLDFSKIAVQQGTLLMNYAATGTHTGAELVFKAEKGKVAVFGSSDEQSYGTFVVDSIKFEGDGAIRVQSARGESFVAGTDYDLITATNGMSGTGELEIVFDNASDFIASDVGNLYQIIAWTNKGSDSNVLVTADAMEGYDFKYVFDASGLYVGYVVAAVPEPSTYALVFGALALGLAVYRRRK